MSDSRVKDGLASWIYLAFTVCAMALVAGPFNSYGIILVVFVEYFNESNNKIGWVFSTCLFLICATSPLVVFLYRRFGFRPVMYAKALGYPLSKSKWLLVARGIGSLISRVGIGYIGDMATKRRKVSYIAEAAAILFGISSGLCSLTQSLPLMILYMSFIGCMEGIYWVILPLMMNELTLGQNADYAYSMMILITAFGFLSGPPTMGWVYDVTGDFHNVLYAVCAGAMTAGVVMAFGTYLTLRQAASTHAQMKEDTVCLKKYGLNRNNILSGLPEIEKLTIIEYETAV